MIYHPMSPTQMTAAFALTSPDHRFVAVSEAFAQLLGYTPAELCGRSVASLAYRPDADTDTDLAEKLFCGAIRSYEIAKRFEHKDGLLVKILLQVSTVADAQRRVAFAVVHAVQVTTPLTAMPVNQHTAEPIDEVEKIKRAMFG